MLSYTDAACVAIALALCLVNERNSRCNEEWCKRRPQYTHENLTDLMLSGPNDYKLLFCAIKRFIILWDTQDYYPAVVKEKLTCEKQSLTVSVYA